jgi:hypothetical protein
MQTTHFVSNQSYRFIRYLSTLLRELDINIDELFGLAAVNLMQRYTRPVATASQSSTQPSTTTSTSTSTTTTTTTTTTTAAATTTLSLADQARPPPSAYSTATRQWSASSDTSGVVYIQLLHINPVRV